MSFIGRYTAVTSWVSLWVSCLVIMFLIYMHAYPDLDPCLPLHSWKSGRCLPADWIVGVLFVQSLEADAFCFNEPVSVIAQSVFRTVCKIHAIAFCHFRCFSNLVSGSACIFSGFTNSICNAVNYGYCDHSYYVVVSWLHLLLLY